MLFNNLMKKYSINIWKCTYIISEKISSLLFTDKFTL